jgi:hypothetical protein
MHISGTEKGKIAKTVVGTPFPLTGHVAVGVVHIDNKDLVAETMIVTQFISSACIGGAGLAF